LLSYAVSEIDIDDLMDIHEMDFINGDSCPANTGYDEVVICSPENERLN
jgi:hypothetical protein